ncbi:hypothetical protein [Saccharopolyspora pogona]|uniref:hypothetical protein n=1 Tax=Saccharopolyspora pogona TaxID=333966 RepID=UPI0016866437|nr:hypothetical protein [Saccharopolyspora pogona]
MGCTCAQCAEWRENPPPLPTQEEIRAAADRIQNCRCGSCGMCRYRSWEGVFSRTPPDES